GVYALDNDTGYIVWQRGLAAAATPCGITSATRIVPLIPPPIAAPAGGGGRAAQAYRSVIGQPGEGAPVEVRGGGPGRGGARAQGPGAPPAPGTPAPASPQRGDAQPARGGRAEAAWVRRRGRRFPGPRPNRWGADAAGSGGRRASSTRSRATASCTCSDCRRAKTSSAPRSSCRSTRDGPIPSPWAPRS